MRVFQWLLALVFIFVLALGWKYTAIGLLVVPMIGFGMVFAIFNGRWFCGNLCPRGQFIDKIFSRVTSTRDIPRVFLMPVFRWSFLVIFMGKMGYSLFTAYQEGITLAAVANAFWWSMLGSSLIALIGGMVYNSRFWCAVCPVGTIGKHIKGVAPVSYTVSEDCRNCGACSKACSFGHNPAEFRGGKLDNSDCIKCGKCIDACKFGAIKK